MSMTREEAIAYFEARGNYNPNDGTNREAEKMALTALRGPTRKMVERMRGEWKAVPRIGVYDTTCSKCGYAPGIRFFSSDFCPSCGAPMTDKAVQMVMERMEALKDGKGD